jgi:hypothetical protein
MNIVDRMIDACYTTNNHTLCVGIDALLTLKEEIEKLKHENEALKKELKSQDGHFKLMQYLMSKIVDDTARSLLSKIDMFKQKNEALKCCGNCANNISWAHEVACQLPKIIDSGKEFCPSWICDNLTQKERLIEG